MTLISSLSKIGSINGGNKNHSMVSNKSESLQNSTTSFGENHSSDLVSADIAANLLYILGIRIKAKVL